MALLDEAIEASGGLTRWNAFKRFTLQLSIDGELISRAKRPVRFKDIVAEGCTRNPLVRLIGFAGPGERGVFRPDSVIMEDPDGNVLRTWHNPQPALQPHSRDALFDELCLVFLCGYSVWNHLTTPFILAHPGVKIEELPPWYEHGQPWRRLQAVFPPDTVTLSSERTFYFDAAGLLRRTDHDLFGIKVAHYSRAHQAFGGIVIPTLWRSVALEVDATVIAKPPLLDVEIFDAAFE